MVVSLSRGTVRDDFVRAWEHNTPLFEQRMRSVQRLCERDVYVVATLSPFADWRDLGAAESRLREYGVPFLTILFSKVGSRGACTARTFIEQLEREHPHLLDPGWQAERLEEVRSIFGRDRVLVGQPGFAALARPHEVG